MVRHSATPQMENEAKLVLGLKSCWPYPPAANHRIQPPTDDDDQWNQPTSLERKSRGEMNFQIVKLLDMVQKQQVQIDELTTRLGLL